MKGDFIFAGGLVVSIFNYWWGRWVVWYQVELPKARKVFVRKLKRWFAGFVDHNRGRHWDRKRP